MSKYIRLEHLGDHNEHLWPADALAISATGRRGMEIDLPDNTIPYGAAPLRTFKRDQIVYVQSIDTGEKPGTKIWYRMAVLGPPQSNPRSNPRAKSHKDVEYAVDDYQGNEKIFKTSSEAAMFALDKSISRGGEAVNVDVLVYSAEGAKWYRGSIDGETEYEEDPEASVFDRIVIRAEAIGRVT